MSSCYFSPLSHYTRNAVFKDVRAFPVDRFFLNLYSSQVMSYLCQKCKKRKKVGVTDFVSGIKRAENHLILKIQHGLQGFTVKNIECESKEANNLIG